ncbi:MAG: twin-arginine translocase TatA/TatE family subunit [Planctomycetia bacterium]|nr:twin-arginine translocase TatA/TatE family subunit [Planctomycetia bacterium]
MGEFSITHWLILGGVFLLFFGAKRIPEVGASLGKGFREFKRGLSDIGNAASSDDAPRASLPPENKPPKRLVE